MAAMLSHSSRMLRSAANRVDEQRLSARLRRMANRRIRDARAVGSLAGDAGSSPQWDVPASDLVTAMASPRPQHLLTACLDHERAVLREVNATLEGPLQRRRRRRLQRVRDGVERDLARLWVLVRRASGPGAGPELPTARQTVLP